MGKLLKNKKLLIILVVGLVAGGVGAKTFLLKPPPVDEKKLAKQEGGTYTIADPFIVNLRSGDGVTHYVKTTLALGISKLSASKLPAAEHSSAGPAPLEEQAEISDIINEVFAARTRDQLLTKAGRDEVKAEIVKQVNAETELKIVKVYLVSLNVT